MRKSYLLTTVFFAGLWPLGAMAQQADAHHPAETAPVSKPAQAGMPGGMNMMSMTQMMPMMQMMMNMMGSSDNAGMGMMDHVEGRIAYLHAELKITDAQSATWNAFAAALRTNAQGLSAARSMMMGMGSAPQNATLAQRLDGQERWLAARLDGTRAIKAAFTRLYAALSADQKKIADDALAPHMGMGMPMMTGGAAAH